MDDWIDLSLKDIENLDANVNESFENSIARIRSGSGNKESGNEKKKEEPPRKFHFVPLKSKL
jgi:hypothetical protein